MRERWIVIGVVRTGWRFMRRNWGVSNGLLMRWQGRTHVFQAMEYMRWEELLPSVRRRLHHARLQMVAAACAVKRPVSGELTLLVLVRRTRGRELTIE